MSEHFRGPFGLLVLTFCGPLPNFVIPGRVELVHLTVPHDCALCGPLPHPHPPTPRVFHAHIRLGQGVFDNLTTLNKGWLQQNLILLYTFFDKNEMLSYLTIYIFFLSQDEEEEGELKDPNDKKPSVRPVCRFFVKGQCTWGSNCRFIHPGHNDKGKWPLKQSQPLDLQASKAWSTVDLQASKLGVLLMVHCNYCMHRTLNGIPTCSSHSSNTVEGTLQLLHSIHRGTASYETYIAGRRNLDV